MYLCAEELQYRKRFFSLYIPRAIRLPPHTIYYGLWLLYVISTYTVSARWILLQDSSQVYNEYCELFLPLFDGCGGHKIKSSAQSYVEALYHIIRVYNSVIII